MAARNSVGYSAGDASSSPNKNPAGRGRARTWASLLHTSIGRMIAYGWPVASPAFLPTGPATGGAFLIIDTWAARAGELYRPPVYIALADGGGIHVSESLYSTKDDFASNGSARPLRCVIARRGHLCSGSPSECAAIWQREDIIVSAAVTTATGSAPLKPVCGSSTAPSCSFRMALAHADARLLTFGPTSFLPSPFLLDPLQSSVKR